MANPPLWLLRQTILPGGARLQKNRPKWEEPKKPIYSSGYGIIRPRQTVIKDGEATWWEGNRQFKYDFGKQEKVEITTTVQKENGNLDNGEYFKWIGRTDPVITIATCRACGYVAVNKDQRRDHESCGKLLTDAYRLLRKDRHKDGGYMCAVCNNSTSHLCWGVPLCTGCKETWKFGERGLGRVPGLMRAAVDKVKAESGKL